MDKIDTFSIDKIKLNARKIVLLIYYQSGTLDNVTAILILEFRIETVIAKKYLVIIYSHTYAQKPYSKYGTRENYMRII